MNKKQNKFILLSIFFFFLMVLSFSYYFYKNNTFIEGPDLILKKISQKSENIQIYSQHTDTETIVSNIKIKISGDYDINRKDNKFRSVATTSIILPEVKNNKKHIFNVSNISLDENVYFKVQTDSDFIKARMPESNKWLHFKMGQIPEKFNNIATPGPVMDSLKIFSGNGKFLKISKDYKKNYNKDTKELHYTLKLTNEAFGEKGQKILGAITKRVGKKGFIDIWLEKDSLLVKKILMKNDKYTSNTLIHNINKAENIIINAPMLQ